MHNHQFYKGLSETQVLESRKNNGVNLLTPPKRISLWKLLLEKFADPLIIILLVAAALSLSISCYEYLHTGESEVFFEPMGIFIAVFLATGLAFYFERRAAKEFTLLNKVNDEELVKVVRDGNTCEIARKDVVVGDIVVLSTGDDIPADGVLLDALSLQVDESSLTGEPLCMKTTDESQFEANATYPSNYVLRGTKVMEGHGVMRVKKVGDATENGSVMQEAQIDNSVKTPLNEQLEGLGKLITKLSYSFATIIIIGRMVKFYNWQPLAWILIIPAVVFFYLVFFRFDQWKKTFRISTLLLFIIVLVACVVLLQNVIPVTSSALLISSALQTIMIAVTLIVVSVPEGLPMAVTLSLAYSMRSMLKTNNLVRRMHACETMGATTVICTDKTGTLTENRMRVHSTHFYNLPNQHFDRNDVEGGLIAEGIAVNSTASLDLSDTEPSVVGNPTEGALLLWLHENHVDYRRLKDMTETVDELPFSTEYKLMATIVDSIVTEGRVLYVKGAPERVYALSKDASVDVDKLHNELFSYQQQAMRTLGFAYMPLAADCDAHTVIQHIKEHQTLPENCGTMHFQGFVAISDPVRKDVPAAIKECLDAGIQIKIVTGDTPTTAREIAREIGLWTEADDQTEGNIITGPEFDKLTDEELRACAMRLKVIARARPTDKKRLVETLQGEGQVVAVTGDGTNDAPALKAAHVGLSMGDGTSVAKEASDITIIDNSFASIGRAVMWGRSLYRNIQRFLLFQLTVNVSACLIVLVGAFIGEKSPLTITQMLWVNLIMDTFGAMALASLPPSPKVMKDSPRDRKEFILTPSLSREVLGVGILFFLMLLGLLFVFQHAEINSMRDLLMIRKLGPLNPMTTYEQTLLFSIFVWTHVWYMFNAKAFATNRSALHLKNCKGFIFILFVIVVGQVGIIELLYDFFNVCPLSLDDWIIIVALSSIVLWIREAYYWLCFLIKSIVGLFKN